MRLPTAPPITARALAALGDWAVYVVIGGVAFVGSASHVYDLASAHGQPGKHAWEVTALTEVLFAYSGVDLRRRESWLKIIPGVVMACTCAFMIGANLASTTDRSRLGLLVAVWPAAIFLLTVLLAETPRARAARAAKRDERSPELDVPDFLLDERAEGADECEQEYEFWEGEGWRVRGEQKVSAVRAPTRDEVLADWEALPESERVSTKALAGQLGLSASHVRRLLAARRARARRAEGEQE